MLHQFPTQKYLSQSSMFNNWKYIISSVVSTGGISAAINSIATWSIIAGKHIIGNAAFVKRSFVNPHLYN